jgi:hypothetical protein
MLQSRAEKWRQQNDRARSSRQALPIRVKRLPPGQHLTGDFPVSSAGPTPHTALDDWTSRSKPVVHALTHFKRVNPEVAQLLTDRGADLAIRARVPGHYERPGDVVDVSAAEYGAIFPLRQT